MVPISFNEKNFLGDNAYPSLFTTTEGRGRALLSRSRGRSLLLWLSGLALLLWWRSSRLLFLLRRLLLLRLFLGGFLLLGLLLRWLLLGRLFLALILRFRGTGIAVSLTGNDLDQVLAYGNGILDIGEESLDGAGFGGVDDDINLK